MSRWIDFYRWMDGEEVVLGEGNLQQGNKLVLLFEIPDVPTVERADGVMPMNEHNAHAMLQYHVYTAEEGKVRLPHFSYWIRWEPKAMQTELEL